MSTKVMAWVWEHSPATNAALLLHLAMADEARDDGYLSGREFGSTARLEEKCNFGSRQTIVEAREWLEDLGQVLVCRPADRGYGRHNEYVVLMGRDPRTVAEGLGWSIPRLQSELQTIAPTTSSGEASRTTAQALRSTVIAPVRSVHRGAHAAPSASCSTQATEPVDNTSAPSDDRSDIQTVQTGRPVQDRSRTGLVSQTLPSTPTLPKTNHLHLALALQSPVEWDAGSAVENPELSLIAAVQEELASLAPETAGVDWTMSAHRRDELVEHMHCWPTTDDAVVVWAEAALVSMQRFGVPRSARAWRSMWLGLAPPGLLEGEPACEQHAVEGFPLVPVRACARCREARQAVS